MIPSHALQAFCNVFELSLAQWGPWHFIKLEKVFPRIERSEMGQGGRCTCCLLGLCSVRSDPCSLPCLTLYLPKLPALVSACSSSCHHCHCLPCHHHCHLCPSWIPIPRRTPSPVFELCSVPFLLSHLGPLRARANTPIPSHPHILKFE